MKKLFVLVGCPGSGKSTWAKNHINAMDGTANIVSRDVIRFSLIEEDEEYFSKEKQVFVQYIKEIQESLENFDTTIADATHLNEASRNKLILALGSALHDTVVCAVVFKIKLETALSQNEDRKGTRSYVPPKQIKRMFYQQTTPSFDEGFNKIYIYRPGKPKIKYTMIIKEE